MKWVVSFSILSAFRYISHAGWEDAPLAPEGRREASEAGALMAAHGIKLDVVYTSWLSRAIETAWLALAPLDMVWLPIVKTWRLNERMYGALTGLSKKMIQQEYGDAQFRKWRRDLGVPRCCGAFTPSTRLASIRRGRGWF